MHDMSCSCPDCSLARRVEGGPESETDLVGNLVEAYIEEGHFAPLSTDDILWSLDDKVETGELTDDQAIEAALRLGLIEE